MSHLRAAANLVADLGDDIDYLDDLAGALHDSEMAEEAVQIYATLVARQPAALELQARSADAQLVSGRIAAAAETFAAYRMQGGSDRSWIASETVASELAKHRLNTWQDTVAATDLEVLDDTPGKPLPETCRLALALFNSAVAADLADQQDEALLRYLAAVVLFSADDEAWVQAVFHAFGTGDGLLFASLAESAYARRGYAFLDQLRAMLTGQTEPDVAAELLDMLELVFAGTAFRK